MMLSVSRIVILGIAGLLPSLLMLPVGVLGMNAPDLFPYSDWAVPPVLGLVIAVGLGLRFFVPRFSALDRLLPDWAEDDRGPVIRLIEDADSRLVELEGYLSGLGPENRERLVTIIRTAERLVAAAADGKVARRRVEETRRTTNAYLERVADAVSKAVRLKRHADPEELQGTLAKLGVVLGEVGDLFDRALDRLLDHHQDDLDLDLDFIRQRMQRDGL